MQKVVLAPVLPPKVKVGVGTVSRREKCEARWAASSARVQLQEVSSSSPAPDTSRAALST